MASRQNYHRFEETEHRSQNLTRNANINGLLAQLIDSAKNDFDRLLEHAVIFLAKCFQPHTHGIRFPAASLNKTKYTITNRPAEERKRKTFSSVRKQ